jgi:hypothetical protein
MWTGRATIGPTASGATEPIAELPRGTVQPPVTSYITPTANGPVAAMR